MDDMLKKIILEITSVAVICLALLTIKYTLPPADQKAVEETVEAPKQELQAEHNATIDINLATVEELVTIPGVGKVIAQRIVDDRIAHGYYMAPADIIRVKGIAEKTYYKMLHIWRFLGLKWRQL